jgi:prephenate dehydrogenase
MLTRVLILGSSGQAGSLLRRSFAESGIAVTGVDRQPPDNDTQTYFQADIACGGPELESAIRRAECVCVCLPEQVTVDIAPRLVTHMRDNALWVDTLSVKTPISRALAESAGRLEILSINPMFAPALGWRGNAVAVVELGKSGEKSRQLKELLRQWGAHLRVVSAQEHDSVTAALQVATHASVIAFGAALSKLGYDVDTALDLAPPPHRVLLALLYRIVSQNPEVYWDIQAYHPNAASVRNEMVAALQFLQTAAGCGDTQSFRQLFQELRTMLLARQEETAQLTNSVIAASKVQA